MTAEHLPSQTPESASPRPSTNRPRPTAHRNPLTAPVRRTDTPDPFHALASEPVKERFRSQIPTTEQLALIKENSDPSDPINAYLERLYKPNTYIPVDISHQLAALKNEAIAWHHVEEAAKNNVQTDHELATDTFNGRQIEYVANPTLNVETPHNLWARTEDEFSADAQWNTVPLFGRDRADYSGKIVIDADNNPIFNELTPEQVALERYFAAHPQSDATPESAPLATEDALSIFEIDRYDSNGNFVDAQRQPRAPRERREQTNRAPERAKEFVNFVKRIGATALTNLAVIREVGLVDYTTDKFDAARDGVEKSYLAARERVSNGYSSGREKLATTYTSGKEKVATSAESLKSGTIARYRQALEKIGASKQEAKDLITRLKARAEAANDRRIIRKIERSLDAEEKAKEIRERLKTRRLDYSSAA